MREQPQQQQQAPQREVEVRPRKQEKVWMWIAIVLGLVLVFLFVRDYLHFNAWVLVAAGIVLLIILLVVLREVPPPNMWDVYIRQIRKTEYKETRTYLPLDVTRVQSQPYGKYWLYQVWVDLKDGLALATYWWEVQPGRVVGRRIMPIDDIMHQMDESKIATLGAKEAIMRYERGKLLEQIGFDTEEEESQ